LRHRDQFDRICGQGTIEPGRNTVDARRLIIGSAVEHQFVAAEQVEQFVFCKFAPLASCSVLKLPVVATELLVYQQSCRPDLYVSTLPQSVQ
jgi:hypothetical protein